MENLLEEVFDIVTLLGYLMKEETNFKSFMYSFIYDQNKGDIVQVP
jgi:hypothetical protein